MVFSYYAANGHSGFHSNSKADGRRWSRQRDFQYKTNRNHNQLNPNKMMKAVSCALVRSSAQALSTGLRASGVAVNAVGKHTSPTQNTSCCPKHYIMLYRSPRFVCGTRENQS